MGMFDDLKIDKKHLPDELKKHEDCWQTKSLDCQLDHVLIDADGRLRIKSFPLLRGFGDNQGEVVAEPEYMDSNYTGEVRFYQDIKDVWTVFVAFFVNGQMDKLILLKDE
jgi:hypothetical protein